MFQTLSSPKKRRANSIIASLLLHVIALTLCLYRAPIFVKPSSLAWGQHGRSETLVYTAQAQLENQPGRNIFGETGLVKPSLVVG